VDAGGGVICMVFENAPWSWSMSLHGRWDTGDYVLLDRSNYTYGAATLGVVHNPTHPIMDGVSSFDGGWGSYRPATTSVFSILGSKVRVVITWIPGFNDFFDIAIPISYLLGEKSLHDSIELCRDAGSTGC
jgi:hypothetical protein